MHTVITTGESLIRIYVLEPNRLLRQAFVRLLSKRSDFKVVGDSGACGGVIDELSAIICDVLLLNSLESFLAIRQKAETSGCLGKAKVVLFGMHEDPETFLQAVRWGARGYLLFDASSTEIIAAVRSVAEGEAICPRKLCKVLFENISKEPSPPTGKMEPSLRPVNGLTYRQRQLMTLVEKGMTNKEIASTLNLSEFTIKNHIHRIMSQLRVDSRHAAVDRIRTGELLGA